MTELELYKFITDNELEYHWVKDNTDVILFVEIRYIEDFNEMLGYNAMDESGIECRMKYKYFCFYMNDICEYFGIEIKNIFK